MCKIDKMSSHQKHTCISILLCSHRSKSSCLHWPFLLQKTLQLLFVGFCCAIEYGFVLCNFKACKSILSKFALKPSLLCHKFVSILLSKSGQFVMRCFYLQPMSNMHHYKIIQRLFTPIMHHSSTLKILLFYFGRI